MQISGVLESARTAYEGLTERERRLVTLLAGIFAFVALVLPIYLMTSAISDIETENRELADLIREMSRSRGSLVERAAKRKAAQRRYQQKTPELRRFVEDKGRQVGLAVRETTGQPEKTIGGYRRRHLRVNLPNVGLRPVVMMMSAIENSPYPVAITRLSIEHYQAGDKYNVQMDVVSYEPIAQAPAATTTAAAE